MKPRNKFTNIASQSEGKRSWICYVSKSVDALQYPNNFDSWFSMQATYPNRIPLPSSVNEPSDQVKGRPSHANLFTATNVTTKNVAVLCATASTCVAAIQHRRQRIHPIGKTRNPERQFLCAVRLHPISLSRITVQHGNNCYLAVHQRIFLVSITRLTSIHSLANFFVWLGRESLLLITVVLIFF